MLRIKELRSQLEMTQADLAVEMGVGQNTISHWETELILPRTRDLPHLAQALRCSISDLFDSTSIG